MKERMQSLLRRFRIQAELVVVESHGEIPNSETLERFAQLTNTNAQLQTSDEVVGVIFLTCFEKT
jgi:hypothetical protein